MAAKHSDDFEREAIRIATSSGLTRRQVASDLGIGLSSLGKWIRPSSHDPSAVQRNTSTAFTTHADGIRPSVGNHPWLSKRSPPDMSYTPERKRCSRFAKLVVHSGYARVQTYRSPQPRLEQFGLLPVEWLL